METRDEAALTIVDVALAIVAEAAQEYRRRWPVYMLTVIVGWWSLIIVELILIGVLGAPVLTRLEPLLFRSAATGPFEVVQALSGLTLEDIGAYLALIGGLLVFEALILQNVVVGALINLASGRTRTALGAYIMGPGTYLNLIGVALATVVMIFLPSLLLVLPLCGVLAVAPQLVEAGAGRVAGQLLIICAALISLPSSLLFVLRFGLAPQLVVVERRGAIAAVRGSWRLLRGWRGPFLVFAVLVLLAIGSIGFSFIIPQFERELSRLAVGPNGPPLFTLFLISHAFSQIMAGLLLPFQAISLTLIHRRLAGASPVAPASVEYGEALA